MKDSHRGPQSLQDYKEFLRRRKWFLLLPWLAISVSAGILAYWLPSIYRSSATILIESQQVPQDLVRTTVTTYAEERIKSITQQILGRQVLTKIIKEYGLYQDLQDRQPIESVLEKMREDISIEMVGVQVPDRRGGRPFEANVAFTVSYEGRRPDRVMQVANRLASLFLEYNMRIRENLAETTTKILEEQVERYRNDIRRLEEKIARFKEEHLTELPELVSVNLETERQLKQQIERVNAEILSLKERKAYWESQLAAISPLSRITDEGKSLQPRERLEYLRNKLLVLKAQYSPRHPDVIKIRREIAALENEFGFKDGRSHLKEAIERKEAELERLRRLYKDKHPDVLRLEQELAEMRNESGANTTSGEKIYSAAITPSNPAYVNARSQLHSVEIELDSLREQRRNLEAKWQQYVKRLEQMPRVEQDYRALTRDYQTAQRKYAETMDKLMDARQAEGLEHEQAGEKFTIIDPPQLPERPVKPQRLAIALVGFALGLGAGVGFAAFREFSDVTIRTVRDLEAVAGPAVLASIPDFSEMPKAGGRRK